MAGTHPGDDHNAFGSNFFRDVAGRDWNGARWRGPGLCGLFHDPADGRDLIVYHADDADHDARPTLRLTEFRWTADGWPIAVTRRRASRA